MHHAPPDNQKSPDLQLSMAVGCGSSGGRRLVTLLGRDARRPGRFRRLDADVPAGVVARQKVAASRRHALHLHAPAEMTEADYFKRVELKSSELERLQRARVLQTKGYLATELRGESENFESGKVKS